MALTESLSVIRSISRELKLGAIKNPSKNDAVKYMMDSLRKHDVTDERTCRPKDELKFMSNAYLCYLQSNREYRRLHEEYHSKDRSVEESAKLVGLEVPKNSLL